jgi:hypothetical protein
VKDIAKLMDGVYEGLTLASDGGPFHPIRMDDGWLTACNEAFNLICMKMGYDKFDRMTAQRPHGAISANQMFDAMSDPNGDWRTITNALGAQDLANTGALVAASFKNETGHGHIATVIPGTAEPSASWGSPAPKLFNVGKDVFIGKKASFAFQKNEMPIYFTLKGIP